MNFKGTNTTSNCDRSFTNEAYAVRGCHVSAYREIEAPASDCRCSRGRRKVQHATKTRRHGVWQKVGQARSDRKEWQRGTRQGRREVYSLFELQGGQKASIQSDDGRLGAAL